MRRFLRAALVVLLWAMAPLLGGCMADEAPREPQSANIIFVIPGSDGGGPWYNDLTEGLRSGISGSQVQLLSWGVPLGVLPNLRLQAIREEAEAGLADHIQEWHLAHPRARISLVGHSAGCGVILEALASLPPSARVDQVVLLAPATSNRYDLAPALKRIQGTLHVFFSPADDVLPGTLVTGTYDNVWCDAAGVVGFTSAPGLPASLRGRLRQYKYDPRWAPLGCDGSHLGWRSEAFVQRIIDPLLRVYPPALAAAPPPPAGPPRGPVLSR